MVRVGDSLSASPGRGGADSGVRILEWDTAFFGFPVARLTAEGEGLRRAVAELRLRGVRLAVAFLPPGDAAGAAVLAAAGAEEIEVRAQFAVDTGTVPPASPEQDVRLGIEPPGPPRPALLDLALESGWRSRFRRDPRFGEAKFRELYRLWLERGLAGEEGEIVVVAERKDGPGGLVTLSFPPGEARIGLIASRGDLQGRGIGGLLVREAAREARLRERPVLRVNTQADNAPAMNFYVKAGFHEEARERIFHLWLD